MKEDNGNMDGGTFKKIGYVILWSIGLFVATFYTFIEKFNFSEMSTMPARDMAEQYLFPLFMAMALFLLDANHAMITEGRQISSVYSVCFISFILFTVFSILVNQAVFGWIFFSLAWVALTVLKGSMTLDVHGIEIDTN